MLTLTEAARSQGGAMNTSKVQRTVCHPGCYPDGYCVAPPDIHDPKWKGNTKPMQAIFVAPPNARLVK